MPEIYRKHIVMSKPLDVCGYSINGIQLPQPGQMVHGELLVSALLGRDCESTSVSKISSDFVLRRKLHYCNRDPV